jgi:4-hydroxy-3-polyprenylbenzoate decarboxylase
MPGILVVRGPAFRQEGRAAMERLESFAGGWTAAEIVLVAVVDDSAFAQSLDNWIWVTFTRSNPAADIYGGGSFSADKHWGCDGPLIIDARTKPHHAPALEEDPAIAKRVEALAARGGPLHGIV